MGGHDIVGKAGSPEESAARQFHKRSHMGPLSEFHWSARSEIDIVLTDTDDTLVLDRSLPTVAYTAMERLRAAGKIVVPATGRPTGWCDLIARLWPVDGVVGENGAFYFHCGADGRTGHGYHAATAQRAAHRRDLQRLKDRILKEVPGAAVAADQAYREFDLAIDFAEEVERLDDAEIERIVECFAAAGATAKVWSIHVNGWHGDYDQFTMSRRLLTEIFGIHVDKDNSRIVFVGDSPNDEPMFGYFENAVAVANFAAFAGRVQAKPRWVTRAEGDEGFAEFAVVLLAASAIEVH